MENIVPLFSVRNLNKSFPNGFEALSGINLELPQNKTILIAGANGSGKTILMQILSGLIEPTEGEIYYKGKPLNEYGRNINRKIGLVFQDADAQILGETVEEDIRFGPENMKLPKKEIDRIVDTNLGALSLYDKRDSPAKHLSGGEKRRLAAAGVLAMGSETIIMDEPFANLDWPGVVQVLNLITDMRKDNRNIILLSHDLEKVLALMDHLVILEGGQIRDQGECEMVLNRLDPSWGVRDPRRSYKKVSDCSWLSP